MLDNEKVIDYLEQQIPQLAVLALKQAYWQALSSGSSVLVAKNNVLIKVSPDGSEEVIKQLTPWTLVQKGQILEAKC
jgi:hypothetical protein